MNDETTTDEPDQNESKLPAVRTKGSLVPLDPFTAYLQEVKKYPLLSADEEKELAIRYKETGDLESAYKLTTANLMQVIKIAMTFKREWQNLMDLIQEGNVGLMKAVKNFDPFRGVPLSAYATWWIKYYILKHILDNWRLVRVGTTNARRKLLFNLKKEKEKLEREGFDPTTKLLAERFGVDEGEVIDVSASIGAMHGIRAGLPWVVCALCGMMTSTFGGMTRDVSTSSTSGSSSNIYLRRHDTRRQYQ